ncbi:MAG: alpha/beta fold hydrolase [Pseudobacteriovorax sp.]|nr:alpha/beta fold hydrolase [Pseudobacteriovorax sp.]
MIKSRIVRNVSGTLETVVGSLYVPLALEYRRAQMVQTLSVSSDVKGVEENVFLKAYVNRNFRSDTKGLAVILHGWQGSSLTPDMIDIGRNVFAAGFHTARINFRDHGGTTGWNERLFHGGLIQEMEEAIRLLSSEFPETDVYLIGCSLGGNFALRLGASMVDFPNLKKVVAVCPAMNPRRSIEMVDSHPLFRRFFLGLWRRALREKSRYFPEMYDIKVWDRFSIVQDLIDYVVDQGYFPYSDVDEYYDSYKITPELLENSVPMNIIGTWNDPVIDPLDMTFLFDMDQATLDLRKFGGHISFTNPISLRRRLSAVILEHLVDEV